MKKVVAQDLKTVSECPICGGAGFLLHYLAAKETAPAAERHKELDVKSLVGGIMAAEIEAAATEKIIEKILDKGLSNDKKVEKRKKGKAGQQG